jgi:ABC-type molybdate transport system substrate-binding protein
MIPDFERRTGHKVKATYGSGGGTKAQVIRGEPFDVPVVQLPLEPVLASGHVIAGSETPLATVSVGVAVRTEAPKPAIATADCSISLEDERISSWLARGGHERDRAQRAAAQWPFVHPRRSLPNEETERRSP